MSYVVTLEDYEPPARYDATPWTRVRFEEAPASAGPWTQIADVALSPVDSNPAQPQSRNLTTNAATLAAGWYRVIFADAASNVSAPSEPVDSPSPSALTRERLARLTDAATTPKLTDSDLDELVLVARRAGAASDAEVSDQALYAAAGEGWRWKAGRVATSTSANSLDGDRSEDTFRYLNCIRQAEHYEGLAAEAAAVYLR